MPLSFKCNSTSGTMENVVENRIPTAKYTIIQLFLGQMYNSCWFFVDISWCSWLLDDRDRALYINVYMYCIKYGVIMNGHFGYCVRIMYMQIYIWENEHVNSVCILIFTTFEQPYSYAVISWWISCCTIWKVVEINSTMKYRWNVKLFRGNLNCSVEIQAALSFPMGKTQQLIPY